MTAPEAGTTPVLDLYGEDFRADPYGVLGELRQRSWYAATPIGTAVLRYGEVQALVSMRELRTPGADFLAMQGSPEDLWSRRCAASCSTPTASRTGCGGW